MGGGVQRNADSFRHSDNVGGKVVLTMKPAPTAPSDNPPPDPISTEPDTRNRPPRKNPLLHFLLPGLSSGALLALAYPNLRWSWLAWLALIPLYLALLQNPRKRDGFLALFGFGFALFVVGASWVNVAGVPAQVVLAAIMGVEFGALGTVFAFLLPRLPGWARPLMFAALWVLTEWVRSLGGYAFPWFVLAATQARALEILQIVSVTGQWGLTFAIAAVNGWLGEAFLARTQPRRAATWTLGSGLTVACLWLFGSVTLAGEVKRNAAAPQAPGSLAIGVVQGNFQEPSPGGDYFSEWIRTYVEVTREAFEKANGQPLDLLLWPEGVCPDELLNDHYTLPVVQALIRETNTPFFIGTRQTDPNKEVFTSAALIGRDGLPHGRYDKVHVVPVGEWFPFRWLLQAVYLQYNVPEKDLLPGRLPNALDLERANGERVRMGTMICYDVAFPWEGRASVQRGAQFFVQLTSDSPFENTSRPEQHADLTALRCAETRRWMVRCAISGISQVVDPTGREVSRIPVLVRRAEIAHIPVREDKTLYVLWGEWFVWLCLAGVFGTTLIVRRLPKVEKDSAK